jgi:hypothetical protein
VSDRTKLTPVRDFETVGVASGRASSSMVLSVLRQNSKHAQGLHSPFVQQVDRGAAGVASALLKREAIIHGREEVFAGCHDRYRLAQMWTKSDRVCICCEVSILSNLSVLVVAVSLNISNHSSLKFFSLAYPSSSRTQVTWLRWLAV